MEKSIKEFYRYLAIDPRDRAWGVSVTGAGYQPAAPGFNAVPKRRHPPGHAYVWEAGRVLSEYAIVVVGHGRGEFDSRGTGLVTLNAGDTILLVPGTWHRYRADKATGWGSYWVHFQGDVPDRLRAAGTLLPERPVVRGGADEAVLQAFTTIVDGLRSESPGFAQVAAARVLEILARLAGCVEAELGVPRLQEMVRVARRLLEEESGDTRDIATIIDQCGMSRTHFFRVFKEQTGRSPHQYRLQFTMRRAGQMLRDSRLSVKEVAKALGFESPFHFSKLFKHKTGLSPRDYRDHWRQNQER